MERSRVLRWGGAIGLGGVVSVGCSPKVHLEFDDATETWPSWLDTTGRGNADESDGGSPDDDGARDDDPRTTSTSPSPSTSSGGGVSSTSGRDPMSTSTTSWDPGGVSSTSFSYCYDDFECMDGYVCRYGDCVVECTDYCCIESTEVECCPSGIYDVEGNCCALGTDEYGRCLKDGCELDVECGARQLCGLSGECETVPTAVECGSSSPLVVVPLEGFDDPMLAITETLAVGDFDGDGVRDGFVFGHLEYGTIVVEGYRQSRDWIVLTAYDVASQLAVGDVDSDGRDDVLVSNYFTTQLFRSTSDGWMATDLLMNVRDPQFADFDGDGMLDLAGVGDGEFAVWFGFGDGTFAPPARSGISAVVIDVSDFDPSDPPDPEGDLPDVAVASPGTLSVVGITPRRTFEEKLQLRYPGEPWDVTMADLDDEPGVDVAVWGPASPDFALYFWSGGAFERPPVRMVFTGLFHRILPLAPHGLYLALFGAVGQAHVRDFMPPCWNWVEANPVNAAARGFELEPGQRIPMFLVASANGFQVTRPR